MTTVLAFVKFMPVHKGHLALIELARKQCDRFIVSMNVTPEDQIVPELRLGWVADNLRDFDHQRPEMLTRFRDELTRRKIPYLLISNSYSDRFLAPRQIISQLLT